ncbi:MAG TPA: hypothetical protein VE570_14470 [Thermoleophilaceae bacterium]|nr:hypothetical protein [Thermoleophilaceae bacterium]
MPLRKLATIASAIAVLAAAGPVAGAGADPGPGATAPCYPEPVWCGPNGQPWVPFMAFPGTPDEQLIALQPGFASGIGIVHLPGPMFGPRPVLP